MAQYTVNVKLFKKCQIFHELRFNVIRVLINLHLFLQQIQKCINILGVLFQITKLMSNSAITDVQYLCKYFKMVKHFILHKNLIKLNNLNRVCQFYVIRQLQADSRLVNTLYIEDRAILISMRTNFVIVSARSHADLGCMKRIIYLSYKWPITSTTHISVNTNTIIEKSILGLSVR